MTPAAAPKSSLIPQDLNTLLPHRQTPWNVSSALFNRLKEQASDQPFKLCEVLSADPEFNFILKYFEHQKPAGYSIKRIVCIHNPDQTGSFEFGLKTMEREASNSFFAPKGKDEEPKADRARALTRWEAQASQFSPVEIKSSNSRGTDKCSKAKVLPLWHGSSPEVCQSVWSSGFTYFGKQYYFDESASKGNTKSTDKGYFGSGIYFTNSVQYAFKYSSQGCLILAWVSMREPYPVVNDKPHPEEGSDMKKLKGQKHYQNYNAHFIPVALAKPETVEYYPCYRDQLPAWDEFVVFEKAQTLPRFWIEIGVDFPKVVLSDLGTAGELLTFLFSLLDKSEIQSHVDLAKMLQAKVFEMINMPEATLLGSEDQRFFKLVKRLLPEGQGISSSVASMLLKSTSTNAETVTLPPSLPVLLSALASPSGFLEKKEDQKGKSNTKPKDLNQIFLNHQKAADQGDANAQFNLALCYAKGQGVARDYQEAAKWYRKAADQGHARAQCSLALCYYKGHGVTQDNQEVAKWYRKAADQGHANAQFNLALCYRNGVGVSRDGKEAVKWYRKAADQGDASAQFNLALCFYDGEIIGVSRDIKEAVKLFRKAADQDHTGAQFNLALCYHNGIGVLENEEEALKWFQKAADQGHLQAKTYVEKIKSYSPFSPFGKKFWARYLGDVGEEPPLPFNIFEILQSPCPFFPGKRVEETHMLTLIPKTVNGKPLTLNYLEDLVKQPKQWQPIKLAYSNKIKREYGDKSLQNSYWILMTRDVIPGSRDKSYEAQAELIEELSQKAKAPYEVPRLLEAATSIYMEYLRTGKRLYSHETETYTRCQERVSGYPPSTLVGNFTKDWLYLDYSRHISGESYGMGGVRKFCLVEGSKQYIAEEKPAVASPPSAPLVAAPTVAAPSFSLVTLAPLSISPVTLTSVPPPAAAHVKASAQLPLYTSLSPLLPVRFLRPTPKSNLPAMAFGKELWDKYLGEVGEEPPLPPAIDKILQSPCPFFPGKRVEETHVLTLIPKTVNGKPLTLNYLEDLVKCPKEGESTQYREYWDVIKNEYGSQPVPKSYWVLMTRDVIPTSRNKSYEIQVQLLNELSQKAQMPYEIPHLLEAATSVLMEYLRTGKQLYNADPCTYTRCQETFPNDPDRQLLVGRFSAGFLNFSNMVHPNFLGVGGLRKF